MQAERQKEMRLSKLYKASAKAKTSLKTTVPNFYVELLELTDNDSLQWDHVISKNGEIVLTVKKAGRK